MKPAFLQLPQVSTLFEKSEQIGGLAYHNLIKTLVEKLLTVELRDGEVDFNLCFLPVIEWHTWNEGGLFLSIYLLCEEKMESSLFFNEMISRWLIPHKTLKIVHSLSTTVRMEGENASFLFCENIVEFKTEEEREWACRHLPILAEEITTGACSISKARRILEFKGITSEEKGPFVQNYISQLHEKFPEQFREDLFLFTQRFLVLINENYKNAVELRHLCRLITSAYSLSHRLLQERITERGLHPVFTRLFQYKRMTPLGLKPTLGLLVALQCTPGKEIFELDHLESVLSDYDSSFKPIEGSYHHFELEGVQLRYVEWPEREAFTFFLLKKQTKEIERDLSFSIEKRVKQVFLPRNEEEILKNSIVLCQELKHSSDLPQLIINFENQKDSSLVFNVIIARILKPKTPSFETLLAKKYHPHLKVCIERSREMGKLSKSIHKELTIVCVEALLAPFLRKDHSVDILQARQEIVKFFEACFGPMRDYNGGLIARNDKACDAFLSAFYFDNKQVQWLAKNFFHALYPLELRSVIATDELKFFFKSFLQFLDSKKGESFFVSEGSYRCFFKKIQEEQTFGPLYEKLLSQTRKQASCYVIYFPWDKATYIGVIKDGEGEIFFLKWISTLKI